MTSLRGPWLSLMADVADVYDRPRPLDMGAEVQVPDHLASVAQAFLTLASKQLDRIRIPAQPRREKWFSTVETFLGMVPKEEYWILRLMVEDAIEEGQG